MFISGMIILSMCISLISEVVTAKLKSVAQKMGFKEEKIRLDVVQVKERIPVESTEEDEVTELTNQ